uniref:Cyclotide n=1 Tax=Clitoria ternatea TaxID=43366 RepID=A0A7G5F3A6_CLITE|nr:cyclotide precursor [Clitoria ternatea]
MSNHFQMAISIGFFKKSFNKYPSDSAWKHQPYETSCSRKGAQKFPLPFVIQSS